MKASYFNWDNLRQPVIFKMKRAYESDPERARAAQIVRETEERVRREHEEAERAKREHEEAERQQQERERELARIRMLEEEREREFKADSGHLESPRKHN